jgi:NADPH:quinone reductase-like Zn-dependent oxidoreductase
MAGGRRRSPARVLKQVASMPLLTPLQLMNGNKTVAGVHIGRLVNRMDLLAEEFTEVLALWAAGTITPRIDASYPFAKAAEAHRRILSHGNTGKILLIP